MAVNLQTGFDILYLSRCVLQNTSPDADRVQEMNLEQVFSASKFQSMEAIAFAALEGMPQLSGSLREQWKQCCAKAQRKEILFDLERAELEDWLEESGIWYLPLKGCILKSMYPRVGIRQMSDNDILFDPKYQEQVRDWFTEHGYRVVSYGEYNHDVYQKDPVLDFEMHTALFFNLLDPEMAEYWKDVLSRTLPAEGKQYEREMRSEDFYLYVLCHSYRHFTDSGTGLRILLDLQLFLKQYENTMDWGYLRSELEKLGITEFEARLKNLVKAVFGGGTDFQKTLGKEQRQLLEHMLGAGTYGTAGTRYINDFSSLQGQEEAPAGRTKLIYYCRRLIPDRAYFNSSYDLQKIYRNPVRRWCYIVKRIWEAIFVNRKRIFREIKFIKDL